ncbi:MAG: RNA 2',3'-cyclic phosphodiesterase [Candidatus Auribacterota bacterium]|jgi:2'-5' RNA ligase|nr:RNA 2',3'-cyclic phosphodiesterase [Candidatus Auribacterota bacterium]
MDESCLRLFIALTLPDDIRATLEKVLSASASMPDKVKWVEPNNLHLTLKFLGNVPKFAVNKICSVIDVVISSRKKFVYELQGLGCFPNLARPRVLFAGASQGMEQLKSIAQDFEDQLVALGFEKENRDFKPHITLGRFKHGHGKTSVSNQLLTFIGNNKSTYFGSFTVSNITLVQSILKADGPLYTPLYTQHLK